MARKSWAVVLPAIALLVSIGLARADNSASSPAQRVASALKRYNAHLTAEEAAALTASIAKDSAAKVATSTTLQKQAAELWRFATGPTLLSSTTQCVNKMTEYETLTAAKYKTAAEEYPIETEVRKHLKAAKIFKEFAPLNARSACLTRVVVVLSSVAGVDWASIQNFSSLLTTERDLSVAGFAQLKHYLTLGPREWIRQAPWNGQAKIFGMLARSRSDSSNPRAAEDAYNGVELQKFVSMVKLMDFELGVPNYVQYAVLGRAFHTPCSYLGVIFAKAGGVGSCEPLGGGTIASSSAPESAQAPEGSHLPSAHQIATQTQNVSTESNASETTRKTAAFISPPAHPSFNCALAHTVVEGMICGSTKLSAMDSKLASLYEAKLKRTHEPSVLRGKQLAWIRKRNACGANVICLEQSYQERIAQLQQ